MDEPENTLRFILWCAAAAMSFHIAAELTLMWLGSR